jgi:zinc transport system ATP-binding protein
MKILSVQELFFRYHETDIICDISFNVDKGDYIGLVGPNGSGKTTLIRIILGMLKPYRGKIQIFGRDNDEFTDRNKIGYLPQKLTNLNPRFPATVREVVSLGLLSGKPFPKYLNSSDEVAIDNALDSLDIRNIKHDFIADLSGGQLQRVLAARAIVNNPEFLIMDEPTTALDPEMRERFFLLLSELNKNRSVTIIMVTHDIGTIGKYASKLLYIDKKVVFYGSFSDFCMSKEITNFFGESAQHIICHRHH